MAGGVNHFSPPEHSPVCVRLKQQRKKNAEERLPERRTGARSYARKIRRCSGRLRFGTPRALESEQVQFYHGEVHSTKPSLVECRNRLFFLFNSLAGIAGENYPSENVEQIKPQQWNQSHYFRLALFRLTPPSHFLNGRMLPLASFFSVVLRNSSRTKTSLRRRSR